MEVVSKIKMGSSVFFDKFDGFKSKDTDFLCFCSNYIEGDKAMRVNIKGDDLVLYREDYSKNDFMKEALESGVPMKLGKFLAPEFIERFNISIDDLKKLKPLADKLDERHKYEKIIYDAYIENDKFELTDEQLKAAYNKWQQYRSWHK